MPIYRLDIAYDGSAFHGYARQPEVRTVQGELEEALARVLGRRQPPATSVAGRTDAGVHARRQVVSMAIVAAVDSGRLQRSLNKLLAPEIVVAAVTEEAADFDARYSARARTYRYRVLNAPLADPFRRLVAWHVPVPLDVGAMQQAVGHIVGEHDFASFCRAREGQATTRRVLAASWATDEDEIVLTITAESFCHQMVRSIVALCAEVGRGRVAAADVPEVLAARDRNAARGAAPSQGLVLWDVEY